MPGHPSIAFKSFSILTVIGVVWGLTIPLSKIVVSSGHQPLGLIFWQSIIAIAILGPVLWWRGVRIDVDARTLKYCLAIALIGTLVPNSFSYAAAVHLPAGVIAVVMTTVPMVALLIALALGTEHFAASRCLGIALGVTAMALLTVPEASLPDPGKAIFVLVALIAPICYGMEGNYIALRAPQGLNPMSVLFVASIFCALLAAPLALATGQWVDLFVPWAAPERSLLLSSIAHVGAYCGYMWLVGYAGVVFSSQIAYVTTVAAVVLSIALLDETYSSWVWIAIGLMLAGLMLVQPAGKLPEKT